MSLQYHEFTPAEGETIPRSLTIFRAEGLPLSVTEQHLNYDAIVSLVRSGSEDMEAIELLASPSRQIGERLTKLSENISFNGSTILYDNDPIDVGIARHLSRVIQKHGLADESKWLPTVRFLEKLYQNPSERSRKSLYEFLRRFDFTILPDGDFIAYKGVRKDYRSIHSGPGIVNGYPTNGHLLNTVGSTIAISRAYVDADPREGCSFGLHVGTYSYAKGFAQGVLLRVRVNPRHVVSVPLHAGYQKIRVTEYTVVEASDVEYTETVYEEDEDDWYEEELDEDEDDL